jgi:hypothetical protein
MPQGKAIGCPIIFSVLRCHYGNDSRERNGREKGHYKRLWFAVSNGFIARCDAETLEGKVGENQQRDNRPSLPSAPMPAGEAFNI